MQLTSHTDFGLRILILLGSVAPEHLSVTELASRHRISATHVSKVVQHLAAAGFVETLRGRRGGVRLARSPAEIRVGDVVRALEPHLRLVECFDPASSHCRYTSGCALTGVFTRARDAMLAELDRATLEEVLAGTPGARIP